LWIFGEFVEIAAQASGGLLGKRNRSTFVVLEVFDLAEALRCFLVRLVGSAEIFSLFGSYLVTCFHFFNHRKYLLLIIIPITVTASIRFALYAGWLICVFLELRRSATSDAKSDFSKRPRNVPEGM
jgi:hypothetical protein